MFSTRHTTWVSKPDRPHTQVRVRVLTQLGVTRIEVRDHHTDTDQPGDGLLLPPDPATIQAVRDAIAAAAGTTTPSATRLVGDVPLPTRPNVTIRVRLLSDGTSTRIDVREHHHDIDAYGYGLLLPPDPDTAALLSDALSGAYETATTVTTRKAA